MIHSVEIKGFRSIRDARLELRPLNVLIGPNQSGKTNFLDAISYAASFARKELFNANRKAKGRYQNLFWAGSDQQEFRIRLNDDPSGTSHHGFEVEGSKNRLIESPPEDDSIFHRWGSIGSPDGIDPFVDQVKSITIYPGFDLNARWTHEGLDGPSSRLKPNLGLIVTRLSPSGDDLISFLMFMSQDAENWKHYQDVIDISFPEFAGLKILPSTRVGPEPMWLDRRFPDRPFTLEELSSGTLNYLAYVAVLLAPDPPALIGIEEPESHLHPDLIRRLVSVLEDASESRQIIVTTHSDTLLSYLEDPADVVLVQNGSEGSTYTRPPKEDLVMWLEKYHLGELRETGVLAGYAPQEQ